MNLVPDNPQCDDCRSAATIDLRDTSTGSEHLYCEQHKPPLWPGRNPELEILRYRSPAGNPCSTRLATAFDAPEHRMLRQDMCNLLILGGEGACRYYLSILTEVDHFALWSNEFRENVEEYVVTCTAGAASKLSFDLQTVECCAPYLKSAYLDAGLTGVAPLTRKELGVVRLLENPALSDEHIARLVPTTVKQLNRSSDYRALRTVIRRQANL